MKAIFAGFIGQITNLFVIWGYCLCYGYILGDKSFVPISAIYLPSQGLLSGSNLAVGGYLAIEDSLLITLIRMLSTHLIQWL